MRQSFNSWSALKEAVSSGKDIMTDPSGKTHKVKYKVQDMKHFVIKVINDLDIIDSTGKLTPAGIDALTNYLNDEQQFTYYIGELDPVFFDKKFIVYTVLADGQVLGRAKQKIQFEVIDRNDQAGKAAYPNVPASTQFIDAASFKSLSTLAPTIVDSLVKTGQAAQLEDPTPVEETPKKEEGTQETKKDLGKKFLYTMRVNSKLYAMEFTESGAIAAKTKDGSDPNGTVSYDSANKKVMWTTTLDDASSKEAGVAKVTKTPLFYDMEITNSQDKSFLEKMFTDADFRKKTIAEYEKEYAPFEINTNTIKNMLYFKDGSNIFAAADSDNKEDDSLSADDNAFIQSLNKLKSDLFSTNQPANS